jgi:phosphoenolpyruvate synthase/pyruvate phosphate dikinase
VASESRIIWLEDCVADCAAAVGGKATGLGALVREDLRVPPGFAITTHAYREHVAHNQLAEPIERLAADGASDAIRDLFERSTPVPALVYEVLRAHERLGGASQPVAVRSSASAEDLADASFAGQQESYLWLFGGEQVVQHVLRCWASLFTAQAIAYRAHRGVPVVDLAMGVVVQQMVPAEAAGVLLTIDPVTGDRSGIVIEAAYGLGAAVVNGEVIPDRFCVGKVLLEIRLHALGSKSQAYRFDPTVAGTRLEAVPAARQREFCLADEEVIALARLGKRMELSLGGPQDIEWAIGPGREIFLLQVRPETVWSQKPSASQATPGSTVMDRMLGGADASRS